MKRPMLSMKELAAHLGVSDRTVRRARRKGLIPYKLIGRQIWFDFDAVRRAMRQAAQDPLATAAGRVGSARPAGRRPPRKPPASNTGALTSTPRQNP